MIRRDLTYPSSNESEQKLFELTEECLRDEGVDTVLARRFLLAISEIFTNALVHGNNSDPKKEIRVILEIKKTSLRADIIDQGRGGLKRINNRQPSNSLSEGGRGVDVVTYYADTVVFAEDDKGGLRVSIHFDRENEKQLSSS